MDRHQTRKPETRHAAEFRFVDGAEGKPPRIEGYAAVFNVMSEDLGGFKEIVMPGAFKRSLAAGADVRLMINHEGLPLARSTSGTLALAEDAKGLRFSATLDATDPDVTKLLPKMRRGDLNQCSFAFDSKVDNWRTQDKQQVRELVDVDLMDVAIVTYPAYLQTSAALRSLTSWRRKGESKGEGRGSAAAGDDRATKPDEQRATMTIEDDSLIYYCRWAVRESRDAFDALNCVLDGLARVEGDMSDQDIEACDDLVSQLVDLIAKARRCKVMLEAVGAEDETEDEADEETEPAAATTDTTGQRSAKPPGAMTLNEARLAMAEAQ